MWMIIALSFIAIGILIYWLYSKINYYKHCTKDLEANIVRIEKKHNEEMLNLLNDIKDAQDEAEFLTTHDSIIRRIVNENMEKYAREHWRISKKELELD